MGSILRETLFGAPEPMEVAPATEVTAEAEAAEVAAEAATAGTAAALTAMDTVVPAVVDEKAVESGYSDSEPEDE